MTGHRQACSERRAQGLPYQRVHHLGRGRFLRADRLRLARFQCDYRDTVAVEDPIAGDAGDSLSRRNDPGEIQRVGGTEGDELPGSLEPANRSKLAHRLRQGKLLTRHSGHEATAAYLASRLEPAIDHEQLPPRRTAGLPGEETLEDDTVAMEQGLRKELSRTVGQTDSPNNNGRLA